MVQTIHKFQLALPLFSIHATISHMTPREPYVFEKAILDIVRQFTTHPIYSSVSLANIFSQILQVPDTDLLVAPALESLRDLRVISCSEDDLRYVTPRMITITDAGQEILKSGKLPARARKQNIKNIYDPLRHSISQQAGKLAEAQGTYLPETLFAKTFPGELIEQKLYESRPNWLALDSIVQSIEESAEERRISWSRSPVQLEINSKEEWQTGASATPHGFYKGPAKLQLNCDDELVQSKLESLPEKDIFDNVVIKSLRSINNGTEELNLPLLKEAAMAEFLAQEGPLKTAKGLEETINSFAKSFTVQHDNAKTSFGARNKSADIILPKNECQEAEVLVDAKTNSVKVKLAFNPSYMPAGFHTLQGNLKNGQLQEICAGEILATFGELNEETLRLSRRRTPSPKEKYIQHLLEDTATVCLAQRNPLKQAVAAHFISSKDVWQAITNAQHTISKEYLLQLKQAHKLISSISPEVLDEINPIIFRYIHTQSHRFSATERLPKTLELFTESDLHKTNFTSQFKQDILPNCPIPANAQEVASTLNLLKPLGNFNDDKSDFFKGCLDKLLHSCGSGSLPEIPQHTAVLQALTHIDRQIDECRLAAGQYSSLLIGAHTDPLRLASVTYGDAHYDKLRLLTEKLPQQIQRLKKIPTCQEIDFSTTILAQVSDTCLRYHKELEKPKLRLQKSKKIYVADTCFLIKMPNFLNDISSDDLVIIPKIVVQELDHLKKDKKNKTLQKKVRAAARKINDHKQVIYASAFPELIPQEFGSDNDDSILSTAIAFREFNPVLLTDDTTFALKAQSADISTLNLEEFSYTNQMPMEASS